MLRADTKPPILPFDLMAQNIEVPDIEFRIAEARRTPPQLYAHFLREEVLRLKNLIETMQMLALTVEVDLKSGKVTVSRIIMEEF